MATGYRSRSLVDDEGDTVVRIPEAVEAPLVAPTVVEPVPWIQRPEAPWILGASLVILIGALLLLVSPPSAEDAGTTAPGGASTATDRQAPLWTDLAIPVPESVRTNTAHVFGSVDLLAVAALGPGAAQGYVGSVTTADGPTVRQIFGDHAFSISSPTSATGTPVVAFMPYQAGDALLMDLGEEVTFVGSLMPVPADFAAMVGTDAASIGSRTGVYVRVIPETLRIATPVPEIP